ncbi:MAG TPA: efflux RND transporter periplasmic adaptor subunit [Edaphocola sp.]|nr:efflux RND transporter periplasmic adaptor subunit [Edaphocola sp.]
MKKIIWIIVGVVLIGLMLFQLLSNKKTTDQKVYQYDKEEPIAVSVDTIRLQSINDDRAYSGTFEPNKETKISADVQGKINKIYVDVSSNVSKGQTLIQLDNSLLKLQLQTIQLQIEGLEDDVKRYTILTEADAVQGVQLEKMKLGLRSAKVQKASLLEQIKKTTIKAPFNGIVTAKLNEEGGFAAPGVPLLQITDINTLRFTINVPENDLIKFKLNQNYKISTDVFPDISLSGKVIMTGSKANMGNSFPIQLQVLNTQNRDLKSGMFGKVNLLNAVIEEGIIIPTSAIFGDNGTTKVYIVKNGKAISQPISTSKNIGNQTIISNGLNENDIIITKGFVNLFENANVTIK